ncbi:methionyl-tRNA synthetase [Astrocystis sublimbata]|nr:methionyl-tRNA synthetase [Astrocystis sublimbata]
MGATTNTPVLPEPGKKNILITSALPYCNNVPHLGNIIGSVLSADCFARFSRARGWNTLYICGSDEYGTATATKAIEEKTTPAELCDKYHAIHKRIYEDFCISFDIYGRTSTEQHTQIVQSVFTKLWENGYIEEVPSIQPYCPVHHAFLADRFVEGKCSICKADDARGDQCDACGKLLDPFEQLPKEKQEVASVPEKAEKSTKKAEEEAPDTGKAELNPEEQKTEEAQTKTTGFLIDPRCKLDGATPEARATKQLCLKLGDLEPELKKWFDASKEHWSHNTIGTTDDWFKKGLESRPITRDLSWGVPIPKGLKGLSDEDYDNKVFYVWFDACIGYPSITKAYTDGGDPAGTNWEKWWKNPEDVTLYQFMGKDNVAFHSVVFPASQIGTRENWTKVSHFSTTDYLNYEKAKFSKSRGIGVFGTAVKDTGVDIDVWRWYLLTQRPETKDSEFTWSAFVSANNDVLLQKIGNLAQRILKYIYGDEDKKTKKKKGLRNGGFVTDNTYTEPQFQTLKENVNRELKVYLGHLEKLELRDGAKAVRSITNLGNELTQSIFPTAEEKAAEQKAAAEEKAAEEKAAAEKAAEPKTAEEKAAEEKAAAEKTAAKIAAKEEAAAAKKKAKEKAAEEKEARERPRKEAVANLVLNLLYLIANLTYPYMPNIASSILTQLGIPKEDQTFLIPDAWDENVLKPGHKLGTPTPLFTTIPPSRIEEWKEAFGGEEARKLKAELAEKAATKKAKNGKANKAPSEKKEKKEAKKTTVPSNAPST